MEPRSRRLLETMERRMFVAPSLRKVIAALPGRVDPSSPQATAVVALVVANAWICLNEAALELFRELDAVSALGFEPRDALVHVGAGDASSTEAARLAVETLTAKLGFPPGRRTKVSQVVHDCARAVAVYTRGEFELHALVTPRRLLLEARVEARLDERRLLGSAPAWSPRRIERVADDFSLREGPAGQVHLRALFHATPGVP